MAEWVSWPGVWYVPNEEQVGSDNTHFSDWETKLESRWLYKGAFPVQDAPGKVGSYAYGSDPQGWWVNQNFSPKIYRFGSTTPESDVRAFIETLSKLDS